ncbi:threonine synthase [Breznakiellaceae bacterium SP9]
MQCVSTKQDGQSASFREALLRCLPLSGGLYVPGAVMDLRQLFLHLDASTTFPELVAALAPALLQGELSPLAAARVAQSAFDFEPQLVQLDDDYSLLNLYNGPTGVFKDFGIAFFAAILEELLHDTKPIMVLSAARGDTGVSMAHAFNRRAKITSVLLYPMGQIRGLDERNFVTNGGNSIPIQVRGSFDDCQRLVTETINDRDFAERYSLTSANAINIGRLLPQVLYFLYGFTNIKNTLRGDFVFSVPCGNFGNLIAGLYAWKFGMPVNGFIAAMNANNTFAEFMHDKKFQAHTLIQTISPALDVSSPENYERLLSFYEESPAVMKNMVYPVSVDDKATEFAMKKVWDRYNVIVGPHTAVAFAAVEQFRLKTDLSYPSHTIIIATGHPAKEAQTVTRVTGQYVAVPQKLAMLHTEVKPIALIDPDLEALEGAIASCI